MRIIYLYQYFTTPGMVGSTRDYEIARRLVRRGHQVYLVTTDYCGRTRAWTEKEEAGIRVHSAPVRYSHHMGYAKRMVAFARFAWSAARKAASLPGDVVFATSPPLPSVLPAVHAARKKSIPMVLEVRDLWPEAAIAVGALRSPITIALARWLERYAYRNSARVLAVAPRLRAGVVASGYPEDRVRVIPSGCDLDLFRVPEVVGRQFRRRHRWLEDRPLVVYTGTLGRVNGVDYLARLAAAVQKRDPEIRFLIVGSGCEEEKVRRVAGEVGVLDRNFFLHPPVPKDDIPAILSAADVATSTVIDRKELSGDAANKVFDSLAAARPIAINHEGTLADMIRQTGCGLVLPATDVDSAAEQLTAALRNPLWCSGARAAAATLAEKRFGREQLTDALETVLLEVTGDRKKRLAA
jgi:glycosyltransferase involved in cell wall biosynthesis